MSDVEMLEEFLLMPIEDAEVVLARFSDLDNAIWRGEGLEQYVYVPGRRPDRVLLVAHADTWWDKRYRNGPPAGCGADDRAGCAILWLLREMGHSLLVLHGEEQGHQGASSAAANMRDEIARHQFAVEFDYEGAYGFKCYDVGTLEFQAYVADKTGYYLQSPTSCSDISALCRDICGVNLSVGYEHKHTERERLSVEAWENTLEIARRWLSEEGLPRFALEKAIET